MNRSIRQTILPRKGYSFVSLILLFLLIPYISEAQEEPVFDEITVYFQVQNIGGVELPAIVKNEQVLLPIKDMFDFLKIKADMSADMDSVSGFLISPELNYLIDYQKSSITFNGKSYKIQKDELVRTETNLYLHTHYFGSIFGLDCKFDLRNLAVKLTTNLELPAIHEMRVEEMRKNIFRMKGELKADTIIHKTRPFIHFGTADWSVVSTQNINESSDTRFNLALGSVIAGGEADFFLNYNNKEEFDQKQQQYYLKFVNNDRSYLRQTTLGKITTDAISSIYDPVIGIRLSNTPTTYRQAFGTYPLSDYTSPGWVVELYVNNVLVDYVKADAAGFFTFQVPLVYGNTSVKLKFYGPWGEERSKQQTIVVPFNFLPPKEFEYTINAGMVEDGKRTLFSRAGMNYGISKGITIGAGVEYLSSLRTGTTMPFVQVATRPFSSMLLSGEVLYGVRGRGILSYQFPKNIQLELNYTKYTPGQQAITYNYLEERKITFTLPIKSKDITLYNRMTVDQILLPGLQYLTSEWLISGAIFGVNANLTNYAMLYPDTKPYLYSDLSLTFRTKKGLTLMPQTQYEYSSGELISAKIAVEKYFMNNGFISLSYENNFKGKLQVVQFGIKYDLPFAQAGFTARQANKLTSLMEMARGSLLVDRKSHYAGANNRSGVGRGGIVFVPFLDTNCNDHYDKGEMKVDGLDIRISGGKTEFNFKDSTIRVIDLEPYIYYFVELDPNSFNNVAWKLSKKTYKIVVDPNQLKRIEIPVAVVGEVSGMIYKKTKDEPEGFGRIVLNIFKNNGDFAGKIMTEQDGYYSYLGLTPGKYYAQVDTVQLRKIHYAAEPDTIQFTIKSNKEGDIVEGIDFTLTSTMPAVIQETSIIPSAVGKEPTKPDSLTISTPPNIKPGQSPVSNTIPAQPATPTKTQALSKSPITVSSHQTTPKYKIVVETGNSLKKQYFVQIGAFLDPKNATNLIQSISKVMAHPIGSIHRDNFYLVRFGPFNTTEELDQCIQQAIQAGILP